MIWAEFYHYDAITCTYRPACGSDSVYRFDGRLGLPRQHAEAVSYAQRRGYRAYSLHHGPRYSQGRPRGTAGLYSVPAATKEQTA